MSGRLLLVANPGIEHVGAHLLNAARSMDLEVRLLDLTEAFHGPRWMRSINWWLRGRLPSRLEEFSADVVQTCRDFRPSWMVSTGIAPLTPAALEEMRRLGVASFNFLTDDPWNRWHRAPWFMPALPVYDAVFSPRRANIEQLRALGCRRVEYLPFAYAPNVHFPETSPSTLVNHDVVFIGGGDRDRQPPVIALIEAGIHVALYGGYWDRDARTRPYWRGFVGPQELRWVTGGSKVVLGLVRRANRDGHSMRTFEAPAMRACLLTEDTDEHREIFGAEGECVLYFRDYPQMVQKAHQLLSDASLRERLTDAAYARIAGGGNTYRDRLERMIR
jgi:spore maturation protein CgeB